MPNLFEPDFDEPREHDGHYAMRARLGRQVGAERLGASVFELPPGQAAYPYHLHLTEEELVFALTGGLSLRTPDGWRELERGEVLRFPVGEAGAHQIANFSTETARFLAISTAGMPDVVIQPDADKIGAFERRPDGGGLTEWHRRDAAVGYWDRVPAPRPPGA
jgi:uncharacterized cupin superfamily protein